ncbi:MAG: serine/threonine-protein phosphatase [Spirochaetales bacterium]|nr:serine/threonine-protein phosphatase [Spirochaetales bacterium]
MENIEWGFAEEKDSGGVVFAENQVGSVCLTVEPVHADSPWTWVAEQMKGNTELFALPVERDGGVIGLIGRTKVLEKANKFFENIGFHPLDQELLPTASLDARESIDKVVIELLRSKSDEKPESFLVWLDGKFYGMTNLRRLASRSAELRDLDIQKAREFQEATIQRQFLVDQPWQLSRFVRMAFGVGGDFYQEAAWKKSNLAMVSCFDVSGKAVAGALATASLAGFFASQQNVNEENQNSIILANELNDFLKEILPLGTFVAGLLLFLPLIPDAQPMLEILNFGYGPVYFYQRQEKRVVGKVLKPNLPPLGLEGPQIDTSSIFRLPLIPGTKVYMFSDGMTDLINTSGEQFGEDRLREFLTKSYRLSAPEFMEKIKTEISEWQTTAPQPDDITAVTLQF